MGRKNYTFAESSLAEKVSLQANNLRHKIIEYGLKNGGHIASPLGVVEVIQALIQTFDFTKDKIVFDIGHQAHAYKLLTDRADRFATIGQRNGLSEYPDIHESKFDFYTGGHAGLAVSAALGYAVNHPEYKSIAFLGDGSMTGGQPFEALNQAGELQPNLLVIYNDNDYSVTKSTGVLHSQKQLKSFCQSLGFKYIEAESGHNTIELIRLFHRIKRIRRPVFLYVRTTKGQGYRPAKQNPIDFHWVNPQNSANPAYFQKPTGELRDKMFAALNKLKQSYPELCVVTPAAAKAFGLNKLQELYPSHIFDTGISEQHCVTFAAALALNKNKVICCLPATFLPRAFDQVIDVCLQDIPVVFWLLKPGITPTGPTLQGIFTFPLVNTLPNAQLVNPTTQEDFIRLTKSALHQRHPIFIQEPVTRVSLPDLPAADIVEVLPGSRLTVLSIGNMLDKAQRLARQLRGVQVLYARKIIPFNGEALAGHMQACRKLLILEDGCVQGGVGQHVISNLALQNLQFEIFGMRDVFPPQGTLEEVYEDIGLGDDTILKAAEKLLRQ